MAGGRKSGGRRATGSAAAADDGLEAPAVDPSPMFDEDPGESANVEEDLEEEEEEEEPAAAQLEYGASFVLDAVSCCQRARRLTAAISLMSLHLHRIRGDDGERDRVVDMDQLVLLLARPRMCVIDPLAAELTLRLRRGRRRLHRGRLQLDGPQFARALLQGGARDGPRRRAGYVLTRSVHADREQKSR